MTSSNVQWQKPIPSIKGNLKALPAFLGDRLNFLEKMAKECGEIGMFSIGPLKFVLVNSPDLIRAMLLDRDKDFEKGALQTSIFKPLIGTGLSTSEGEYHDTQRKLLAPAYQPRQVANYANTIIHYTEQIQGKWEDGATIDLVGEITKLNMSIVGKLLFGIDDFGNDPFGQDMLTGVAYIDGLTRSIVPLPLSWPTPKNSRVKKAIERIDSTVNSLIQVRRNAGDTQPTDLLNTLVQARYDDGSRMSDKQVRDEAVTTFLASYDNTSVTLSWAFYLLAQNPSAYAQLHEEANKVLLGRSAIYQDLPKLTYTLQIFKEAMRLYPSAPMLIRRSLRDTEIQGYKVAKGTLVSFSPWVMHRQPNFFTNPERFMPERFAPANEQQIPRFAYLPFGAGSRICPGQHLTMMQGPLILATIAKNWLFELLPNQIVTPKPRTALRPEPGINVKLKQL